MLKKTIKYVDYNGDPQEDVCYFNMTQLELAELMGRLGAKDIEAYVKTISEEQDLNKMIGFIKEIILGSYGKKSEDGKRFEKNAEIRKEFEESIAFAELFEELMVDPGECTLFAEGVIQRPTKK